MTDRLTNSIEFGAPQDRDRILLFGIHKSIVNEYNNMPLRDFEWGKYIQYSMQDIKEISWPGSEPFAADSITLCPVGIPKELTVQYWFDKNDVENHPNSVDCFVPRSGIHRMQTVDEGDDSRKSYKRLHRWR